ncbi:MAG: sigma-54-dependent Fis family transcriptional regulator [Cytophagia bacterium]|nr:sigma-54-dependent Fis family transcriptional regulator [Cytophagia bacterium]
MKSILLIEDDSTFSRMISMFLTKLGYTITVAADGKEGLKKIESQPFHLVLLDYRLPDALGIDLLKEIKQAKPEIPVIIMTSFSDLRTAVRCMRAGAYEYITKPVNPDELQLLVQQALSNTVATQVVKTSTARSHFYEGVSDVSKELMELVKVVAPTELSVIIEGESGTGKENVANAIHRLSKRATGPFVALDCGALSKELAASELFGHTKGSFTGALNNKVGQFEMANGGTLFLDEVGNLSYEVQVKLLRAVQERKIQPIGSNKEIAVDVRIITATNENLLNASKEGNFREDLFHRLNEFKINVPTLQQRGKDVIGFAGFFREQANEELNKNVLGFSEEVLTFFQTYSWPGNLRELKNCVRRAVLLCSGELIQLSNLPAEMLDADKKTESETIVANEFDLKAIQEKNEREKIIQILQEVRYNKSKAAKLLNIDRKTLYAKMEKYNIS